jgi:hypothetical protein
MVPFDHLPQLAEDAEAVDALAALRLEPRRQARTSCETTSSAPANGISSSAPLRLETRAELAMFALANGGVGPEAA